ncbi:MAG: hypothetical protein JW703_01945 [Candidatus Diapherotrites archaeon]|nr:hypothetical protein [Candidatus Diapherotrites archaeon]
MPRARDRRNPVKKDVKPGESFETTPTEIKSLNSSILVLSQKMNYVVRNEKILGRNLLILNKKIKGLEGLKGSNIEEGSITELKDSLNELNSIVSKNSEKVMELEALMDSMKQNFVSKEQFEELKFIIDSINPMKLMNTDSAEKFIESKINEKLSKKGK